VCKFVDRPVSDSDQFLWGKNGIYTPAPISERRILGDEQYQFAAAVLAYDPAALITAATGDAFQQLKMAGLSSFLQTPQEVFAGLPQFYADQMMASRLWSKEFPIQIFSTLTILTAILSSVFVGVTLIWHWKIIRTAQKVFCFTIVLGLVSNALICGALSGPHERYQSRLTWLMLMLASILYYEIRERSFRHSATFQVMKRNFPKDDPTPIEV
jgi:hypothetical protein